MNFDLVRVSPFDLVTQNFTCFGFGSIGGPWMPSDSAKFKDISSILSLSAFDRVHVSPFNLVTQNFNCFEFGSVGRPWMPSNST